MSGRLFWGWRQRNYVKRKPLFCYSILCLTLTSSARVLSLLAQSSACSRTNVSSVSGPCFRAKAAWTICCRCNVRMCLRERSRGVAHCHWSRDGSSWLDTENTCISHISLKEQYHTRLFFQLINVLLWVSVLYHVVLNGWTRPTISLVLVISPDGSGTVSFYCMWTAMFVSEQTQSMYSISGADLQSSMTWSNRWTTLASTSSRSLPDFTSSLTSCKFFSWKTQTSYTTCPSMHPEVITLFGIRLELGEPAASLAETLNRSWHYFYKHIRYKSLDYLQNATTWRR